MEPFNRFAASSEVATRPASGATAKSFAMHHNPPSVWPDFMVGQAEQPARVLLVDDDPLIRHVVAQELLADDRINLLAQAGSVREARRKIAQHEFDVLLVDLNLGDGTGFELIQLAKRHRPVAEVVVFSAIEDEPQVLHAFELGATGFLIKNSWFGNFAQAVLQVVNGGAAITPSLARRLLHRLEPRNGGQASHISRLKLSNRERDVLKMVASGYTSAEIGGRLGISLRTVNAHVRNIYGKLQVKTRAQAVSYATDRGLI